VVASGLLVAASLLTPGFSVRAEAATAVSQQAAPADENAVAPEAAQPNGDTEQPGAVADDANTAAADAPAADAPAADAKKEAPPRPPREVYNEGLDKLGAGDLDAAEKLIEDARSRADIDGLLRRDATYDLGILEARRADGKTESAPEDALAALERSASWFRETVSLDAKDDDARHNLELVLKRALVLADAIAKKKQKELIDDISALMEEQRAFLGTLRAAVQGQRTHRRRPIPNATAPHFASSRPRSSRSPPRPRT
jgi:hypothetical protein